jgi:signal peptidase I
LAAQRKKISLVRWTLSIIILVPLATVLSFFLTGHWQPFKVISGSMEPTLMVNDCVVMREQSRFPNLVGCVVVLTDPKGGYFPLVKRVIAADNSSVSVRSGYVYIDQSKDPIPGDHLEHVRNKSFTVAEGQVFVMGDNRNDSEDSIDFGPVSRNTILGVITLRYWPMGRIGAVH